jgi:hypothetical protein
MGKLNDFLNGKFTAGVGDETKVDFIIRDFGGEVIGMRNAGDEVICEFGFKGPAPEGVIVEDIKSQLIEDGIDVVDISPYTTPVWNLDRWLLYFRPHKEILSAEFLRDMTSTSMSGQKINQLLSKGGFELASDLKEMDDSNLEFFVRVKDILTSDKMQAELIHCFMGSMWGLVKFRYWGSLEWKVQISVNDPKQNWEEDLVREHFGEDE